MRWEIKQTIDLAKGISADAFNTAVRPLSYSGDSGAHTWLVTVVKDGEPVSITESISALFIRPDGNTVTQTGSVTDGNTARVYIPQAAYAHEGVVRAIMRATVNTVVTTIGAIAFEVKKSTTGSIIDPGSVVPDLAQLLAEIDNMRAATAAANAAADNAIGNFAPAFSTSTAYTAGQYVTYTDGKLYQFTTDHAAGAWNSAQVQAVTTGGKLTDLKGALNSIEGTVNDISSTMPGEFENVDYTFVDGKYINRSATEVSNSNYKYIAVTVSNIEQYVVTTRSANNNLVAPIIFADSDGNYVGCYPNEATGSNITLLNEFVFPPARTATIYINRDIGGNSKYPFGIKKKKLDIINYLATAYHELVSSVIEDKYINKTVSETTDANYEYASLQVSEGEQYIVSTSSAFNSNIAPVIFASNNGSYISSYPAETSSSNITLNNELITVPHGANTMYVNRDTNASASGRISVCGEVLIKAVSNEKLDKELDNIKLFLPHNYQNVSLTIIDDKYINRSISEVSDRNYEYAYVTLQENYVYKVTTKSAWNNLVVPIVFVDENGQYLGVYPESSEQANVALSREIITIPDGAKGMYVNRDVNATSTEILVEKGTAIPFDYASDDYENYTWNAVGDSITENGYYMQEVNNTINLPYNNCGVASSTIAVNNTYLQGQSIVERVTAGTYTDADIWTIMGGLNDCLYGSTLGELAPTGSTFDTSTVYGALQAICEYILNMRAHARLVLITPTQSIRDTWSPTTYPCTIALIRQAIIDVGEYYSVPVFDAWGKSGVNAFNIQKQTNPTTRDGVHLNELGADIFGEKLALEIKNALFGIDS